MTGAFIYYAVLNILSIIFAGIYLYRWHKRFDTFMTSAFTLIPIINLAYFLMYTTGDVKAVVVALKITYVGGCYLPWFTMLCIASICEIKINKVARLATFILNTIFFACVLTGGTNIHIFYKSVDLIQVNDAWVITKEYGFVHTIYYVFISLYLIVDVGLIVYAYKKKTQISRRILFNLFFPIPFTIIGYFINHTTIKYGYEIVPFTYVVSQLVYLYIAHRMVIYNVSDMAVETMAQSGDTGFISADFKKRYLGSNETARIILPKLNSLIVDGPICNSDELTDTVGKWIDDFNIDKENKTFSFNTVINGEEKIYSVNINYLYDGTTRRGYQILLEDDTQNQKYI